MTSKSPGPADARNRTQFGWSIKRTRSLTRTGVRDGLGGELESLLKPDRDWSAKEARALATPPVDVEDDRG